MRACAFFAILIFAALCAPVRLYAQDSNGRVTVLVQDAAGLPAANITVTVVSATSQVVSTDARGVAVFTRLVPGRYRVTASKAGLAEQTLQRLDVADTQVQRLTLVLPSTSDPNAQGRWTVDDRSASIGTTVTSDEFDRLPLTGDVWSALRTVPAVVLDRPNIGGTESVSQPAVAVNGASVENNRWSIDGVPVTNMSALGFSTAYPGLSLLDHVRAITSGVDPSIADSGVTTSLQLKSGADQTRASAYASFGSHALSAPFRSAADDGSQLLSYRRLDRDIDGGFEIGGPLSRRRLFAWGGYSVLAPALDVFTRELTSFASAARDTALIQSGAIKLTWAGSPKTRATFTYFGSRKARDGEDAGLTRPSETSLDERATSQFGAVRLDRTLSSSLAITARYALAPATTSLDPNGGTSIVAYRDDNGVWRNSYQFADDHQLQHVLDLDGDYRWHGQALRFGADLRRVSVDDRAGWPGGQFDISEGAPVLLAEAVRDRRSLGHALYVDAYIGDSWRWHRLTFDAGVRWDRQAGSVDAATIDANPVAPGVLPAVNVAAQSSALVWSLVSPRASLAFALDGDSHTILRANYARFASPLDASLAPLIAGAPLESVALITAIDKNGDHVLSAGDVATVADATVSNTRIGNVSTPRTDAIVGEVTHTTDRLRIRGAVTFRRLTETNWLHLDGITGANFASANTVTTILPPIDGQTATLFRVNGAQLPAGLLQTYESRPGYSQQFLGFEASLEGRRDGRSPWRVGFSSGQAKEYFDSATAHYDPTPSPPSADRFSLASPNADGGDVARVSLDSNGQPMFVTTPRFQLFAMTTIRLPWRIDATPAYFLREGFALPYFAGAVSGGADASSPDGKNVLLAGAIADFKLPAVHELDVRFSRPLRLLGHDSRIDVDVFNALDRATPLARQLDTKSSVPFNQITEVMSPLTVRIGVRVPIR